MRMFCPFVLLVLAAQSLVAADFPAWDGEETIAAYAKRAGLSPTDSLDLGGGLKLELVLIPAGSFLMGNGNPDPKLAAQEKQHKVTLSRPFYMGKFEVTQAEYEKVTGSNPSKEKGDTLPVSMVSWDDDIAFCKKVSEITKREATLPTDAQWEFAARAGATTTWYTGSAEADLDKAAWYGANSGGKTHPVGQKVPNAWGLFDMIGNVRELCLDFYADELPCVDATDPKGILSGTKHIGKGGAFTGNVNSTRPAYHTDEEAVKKAQHIGMRILIAIK
jgi:formylglycine-generating enzyme required for sulfatase activity